MLRLVSIEDEGGCSPPFISEEEATLLDEAEGFTPSPDQTVALATLLSAFERSGTYVFTGAAGTGKSTLTKALLRRLTPAWDVLLLAPTWRAANRLREVTGEDAVTIHRAIYGKPVQTRQCLCGEWTASLMKPVSMKCTVEGVEVLLPRYTCDKCNRVHEDATRFPQKLDFEMKDAGGEAPKDYRLILVDESSMVPTKVARDLQRAFANEQTRFLFVGDANQLPPVLDQAEKADVDGAVDLLNPTAALHTVHRQAEGNPVLALAHTLKVVPVQSTVEWPFPRQVPGVHIESRVPLDAPARWAAGLRSQGEDLALIAFSNKTRAALNHFIRHYTGAVAWAESKGLNVIPGDRLLARGNGQRVYNGEVWTVCSWEIVPEGVGLLDHRGRLPRQKPYYEHDRILEGSVGVFQAELAFVGNEAERISVLCVCPVDAHNRPMLESDLIRAGIDASQARQRCREVARAWKEEYAKGIEDRQKEYEHARDNARDKRVAGARWVAACQRGDRKVARDSLKRLTAAAGPWSQAHAASLQERLDEGMLDGASTDVLEGVLGKFAAREDVALAVEGVQAYCEARYGCFNPERVAVFDFGESLTCHSMQGSQSQSVGVVVDAGFWWAWRNDRKAALQWGYTSFTRTTATLAIFSIQRQT